MVLHGREQDFIPGSDALAAVLSQIEGFEAPAAAWETEILPARVADYQPEWLDEHCRAGRFVWTRLGARGAPDRDGPARSVAPIRSTPIAIVARRNVKIWSQFADAALPAPLTSRAAAVADFLSAHGASFFDELADGAGMLPAEVEDALAELAAHGRVNSDAFGGLRALLMPGSRRRRRMASFGMADTGRWALVARATAPQSQSAPQGRTEAVEIVVRTLLRRWGVIFWKLLAREAEWLPPWREVLACCRRLEARGELRGGRFVAGFSGEQYATPEAVGLLRELRRRPADGLDVSISAADPLNLLGILTPGPRLASLTDNRLLYRDGMPIATFAAGEVQHFQKLAADAEWQVHQAVLRRHRVAALDETS